MDTLAKRLKYAREEKGLSQAALAKRIGAGQSTIASIEGRNKGSGKIVQLAQALDVRPEWLESGALPMRPGDAIESDAEYIGKAPKQSLIPVSGFARLGDNGWYEEITASGSEGYVEASSSDPDAYVLMVKGDSMHPAIRNGWYVVVEPNKQPCSGEYAAIFLRDGRKMVKEYLFSAADTVTVESVNGGERLSLRRDDVKVIHAIGSVLMPSKHRNV